MIGSFSEGLPKKIDGYDIALAVAVEGDTKVASTHRLNHPGIPVVNMNMVNRQATLNAIELVFPRSLWSGA